MIRYFSIIRARTGKGEEKITLSNGAVLLDLIPPLVDIYGQSFDKYIFNDKGELNSYIRIARKGQFSLLSLE